MFCGMVAERSGIQSYQEELRGDNKEEDIKSHGVTWGHMASSI